MAKGGNFERDISKVLSIWWTNGERDDVIWHTSGSGGRATNRKRSSKAAKEADHGDLKSDDPCTAILFSIFSFELKSGYARKTKTKLGVTKTNWSLTDLLDSQGKCIFSEFWGQCCSDANDSDREPVLIFRRNNKMACIAIHTDLFNMMLADFGIPGPDRLVLRTQEHDSVTVCNLNEFLEWSSQKFDEQWLKSRFPDLERKRKILCRLK